jgi:hypothetical protein
VASGADLLVNAAGPDAAVRIPALKAPILARINYIDIASERLAASRVEAFGREVRGVVRPVTC